MLHCRKKKKSDESKYNVLLFSFVSHLRERVVFIHKEKFSITFSYFLSYLQERVVFIHKMQGIFLLFCFLL